MSVHHVCSVGPGPHNRDQMVIRNAVLDTQAFLMSIWTIWTFLFSPWCVRRSPESQVSGLFFEHENRQQHLVCCYFFLNTFPWLNQKQKVCVCVCVCAWCVCGCVCVCLRVCVDLVCMHACMCACARSCVCGACVCVCVCAPQVTGTLR